jgi:hypothetical protein
MPKFVKPLIALCLFALFGAAAFADPSSGLGTGIGNGITSRP